MHAICPRAPRAKVERVMSRESFMTKCGQRSGNLDVDETVVA